MHRQLTETMELPLFPLNTVLFPGMTLPLHIFEPRYRQMIERCLEDRSPFGVVLMANGAEPEQAALPHRVGTMARIIRVQREDDGRLYITASGIKRFRVEEFNYEHAYLSAQVRHMPFVNGGTQVAADCPFEVEAARKGGKGVGLRFLHATRNETRPHFPFPISTWFFGLS